MCNTNHVTARIILIGAFTFLHVAISIVTRPFPHRGCGLGTRLMNLRFWMHNYTYKFTVGAEVSQTNTSELKFLFEGHEDFSTIPSYAVLPAMVCIHTWRTLVGVDEYM